MSHSETNLELTDYAAERLEPEARERLEAHLDECPECAEWLATYRLLASGLETHAHPSSQSIAEFALGAPGLPELDREQIVEHLESCSECSREVDLSRKAVSAAATAAARARPLERFRQWARAQVESPARLAAAAGLILAVILATMFFVPPSDIGDFGSATALQGTKVLEAGEEILMADTYVEKGANVTVRAATVVALGNGFSVASDAAFTIEVGNRGPEL